MTNVINNEYGRQQAIKVTCNHSTVDTAFLFALCSVDLFGSVVEYGLVLDFDNDEE